MESIEGYSLSLPATEKEQEEEDASSALDLTALVHTYAPLLFRVAHSVLRSPSEAEDVVQEVFLRTVQRRASLPAIRDLRVWLIRIAWNLALDRRRRIRPGQIDQAFAETLAANALPADQAIQQAQRMTAVLHELERLPRAERHALLLSAVEELGTPEIAQVLNRTESAVRALISRARARLRARMGGGKRNP